MKFKTPPEAGSLDFTYVFYTVISTFRPTLPALTAACGLSTGNALEFAFAFTLDLAELLLLLHPAIPPAADPPPTPDIFMTSPRFAFVLLGSW
jgi:hypothetical protein